MIIIIIIAETSTQTTLYSEVWEFVHAMVSE